MPEPVHDIAQEVRDVAVTASTLTKDAEKEFGRLLAKLPQNERALAATDGLIGLLAEPLSYDFTRLLLNSVRAQAVDDVLELGGLQKQLPDNLRSLPAFCSVANARTVYEPAVDKRVEFLLELDADVNCEGRPQRPLMCCAMNGWVRTARRLLAAKADVLLCDASGSAALHYASTHHEAEMCALLLAARADPSKKDGYGRSAWDIVKTVKSCCLPQMHQLPASIPEVLQAPLCSWNILQLEARSLTQQRFIEDFVALKRPVLIKRGGRTFQSVCSEDCCRSGFSWQREDLLRHASEARAMASEIPYGSDFGVDPSVEQPVTLQEFLSAPSVKRRRSTTGLGIHEPQQKKRMYFFVAVDDEAQPQLSKLFSKALHLVVGGPLTFPCFDVSSGPSGSPFRITTLQFAVGEEGSGSPMHFHQDAVNLLLSGKKRWWLQPPSLAAMSRLHPLDVQRCDGEALQCYDTACVLEQEVGDVMYVPDMWGHAILNLEPHTVCAAAEFA